MEFQIFNSNSDEIKIKIFLYLNLDDLKNANLTCRDWYSVLNSNYFSFKIIGLRQTNDVTHIDNNIKNIWLKFTNSKEYSYHMMPPNLSRNINLYYQKILPQYSLCQLLKFYKLDNDEIIYYITKFHQCPHLIDSETLNNLIHYIKVVVSSYTGVFEVNTKITTGSNDTIKMGTLLSVNPTQTRSYNEKIIDIFNIMYYMIGLHLKKFISNYVESRNFLTIQLNDVLAIRDETDSEILAAYFRILTRHYKSLNWELISGKILNNHIQMILKDRPDIADFIGISKLVFMYKFPQNTLQNWIDKINNDDELYIILINIITYQELSEEFIRKNTVKFVNDKMMKHVALRYGKIVLE